MTKRIGALWCRTSKDGKTQYMTGVLEDMRGEIRIVVFRNTKKESDKHPDYTINLSEDRDERKPQSQGNDGQDSMMNPTGIGASQNQGGDEIDVSQIPF